ncbi:MAG TPA: hypothetical protein VE175_16005 [Woeseiaceae bacterium]|nr:hypothetical protein [Woeseiaceae bacterium]
MKDEEDRKLEALFRSPAIADDGFSERVLQRLRRRTRVRRWTLPIAASIGGLIALKPALEILSLLPMLTSVMPQKLSFVPSHPLPASVLLTSFVLVAGLLLLVRMLED